MKGRKAPQEPERALKWQERGGWEPGGARRKLRRASKAAGKAETA
jgi:hypothetical protein